ncbi:hypothetical protein [Reichenbachiella sp.]|uniref:arsenate-mycothiol transferase ArsC n=1 Tax=Reichenbachiella sp. TaxID=2184521 RepID=UPI0032997EAD
MIRTAITSFLFLSAFFSCSQKKPSEEQKQTVLFVCTHGAARSPIAAAYFNKLAKQDGLNYEAIFRGTEPDEVLTDGTVSGLSADGFDVNQWKPQLVSKDDMRAADKIVTFDCSLPDFEVSVQAEQWNGTPSISKDYNIARNAILAEVNKLVIKLKKDTN